MKKLKDLKENEYFEVKTIKQAKYFSKVIRFGINRTKLSPETILQAPLISLISGIFYQSILLDKKYNQVDASDFIKSKPSTKKLLKEIKKEVKYLGDVVANMNVKPLCTSLGVIEFPFEGNVTDPNQIEVDLMKEELSELPKLWAVERTKGNHKKVNQWALEVFGKRFHDSLYFVSCKGDVLFDIPSTYTKISYPSFVRLVLKNTKSFLDMDDNPSYTETKAILRVNIEQPKEIDFKNGKLFEYTSMSEGLIVMIDLENSKNKNTVLATCVQNHSSHTWCRLGESRYWEKDTLKPFTGEITLKNDYI